MSPELTLKPLLGKTLVSVTAKGAETVEFETASGERFQMLHHQDCCESVLLEKVEGNLEVITGSPILSALESCSNENPPDVTPREFQDSFTWTEFCITTEKGSVKFRWYGESNGYYGESVDFEKIS